MDLPTTTQDGWTDVGEQTWRYVEGVYARDWPFWMKLLNRRLRPGVPVERGSYRPAGWDPLAEEG